MIIIGLVIIISAAILLWSNLDLDLTFWTILGITTGVLLVGGILYLINVPIFIVGGSIVVLLFLITFCLLVYGTFEIPILVIASMILVTLGAGIILYIYVSLLVAILSFLALLIAFFFVADWLEDLFY
ncbi:MAG: hypothetical protein DRI98_12960 [Bacteroidetes bacterium]|nr:MAG: hypothetical protein DRI98_12960 [Bacteroidota bacterium]